MTIKPRNADRLSTRSLLLSALLGTHPPALPGPALVAFVELFGRPAGTARTALSRMVSAGEVDLSDGWYRLTGRLLDRQREQDAGRTAATNDWNGSWITAVAASDKRSVADRRTFRSALAARRFGELRPDIWMRPDHGFDAAGITDLIVTTGPVDRITPEALTGRLWPLADLQQQALELAAQLDEQLSPISAGDLDAVPDAFVSSAAVVRFLRSEPQLPSELQPAGWPMQQLRSSYDEFERALQSTLRGFFAEAIKQAAGGSTE